MNFTIKPSLFVYNSKKEDKRHYSSPAAILSLAHGTKYIPASSSSCQLAHTFFLAGVAPA